MVSVSPCLGSPRSSLPCAAPGHKPSQLPVLVCLWALLFIPTSRNLQQPCWATPSEARDTTKGQFVLSKDYKDR